MTDLTPRTASPDLLEALVCPLTLKPLRYNKETQELISHSAGLAYPIRDGVPVLLPEGARPLTQSEIK